MNDDRGIRKILRSELGGGGVAKADEGNKQGVRRGEIREKR